MSRSFFIMSNPFDLSYRGGADFTAQPPAKPEIDPNISSTETIAVAPEDFDKLKGKPYIEYTTRDGKTGRGFVLGYRKQKESDDPYALFMTSDLYKVNSIRWSVELASVTSIKKKINSGANMEVLLLKQKLEWADYYAQLANYNCNTLETKLLQRLDNLEERTNNIEQTLAAVKKYITELDTYIRSKN